MLAYFNKRNDVFAILFTNFQSKYSVFLCGSVVEQSAAQKVVGSIPREHTYWLKKCITWMQL